MQSVVKEDILRVIKDAIDAIKKSDATLLVDLSNHTIHNASIFQDKDSVNIAVVMYSLSKIMQRHIGKVEDNIVNILTRASNLLMQDKYEAYSREIESIYEIISKTDRKLRLYITHVINEAQVRKGSKLYEHGISVAKAAEVLGVSQWELLKYVGRTSIIDRFNEKSTAKERLKLAREIFGVL